MVRSDFLIIPQLCSTLLAHGISFSLVSIVVLVCPKSFFTITYAIPFISSVVTSNNYHHTDSNFKYSELSLFNPSVVLMHLDSESVS